MGSKHTPRNRRASRREPVTVVLIGVLALTACAGGSDDSSITDITAESSFENVGAATASPSDLDSISADAAGGAVGETEAANPARPGDDRFDIGVIGRDVVVEMRVVLSSDDIARSVASIMADASTLGGGVASSDVDYGGVDGSDGSAVLVVKVPPESVDRMLSGLADTGTVQSINQSAQDVTDQLVNLDVRIRNARRSVDSVREFMDATRNLNELVMLEAELTRRETELEQLEAQQRNVSDRVALATITIDIVPTASVPEPVVVEGDRSIGDALNSGWEAFVAVFVGIAVALAATLPFLVSGLLLVLVAWSIVRRREDRRGRQRAAGAASPMPAPPGEAPDHATSDRETEPVG